MNRQTEYMPLYTHEPTHGQPRYESIRLEGHNSLAPYLFSKRRRRLKLSETNKFPTAKKKVGNGNM